MSLSRNEMALRVEVASKVEDARASTRLRELNSSGSVKVNGVKIVDVYTIDGESSLQDPKKVADMLTNSVFQRSAVNSPIAPNDFSYAIEVGFHPGVTDNIGNTAGESISDLSNGNFDGRVYTSQVTFVSGDLTKDDALRIGNTLANPLIQRIHVKSRDEFERDRGMGTIVPRVRMQEQPPVTLVNLLNATDEELELIGKKGIANPDGTRRGPLALDLVRMTAIKKYFEAKGENPTDLAVESIAQTWSEHCEHTIFADPMDEIKDGLYKRFIRRATNEIRAAKGNRDICVSVFTDNAGGIVFDENHLITDKVETHNSPSALDPFGGSITGIVGVNRDAIGFGLGAKPIINRYGFCFGDPSDERPLYRGENKKEKMLSPKRIMEGVIAGVNAGGNQSGIPTTQGFAYFDSRFRGKPLVFVGTLGLIPKEVDGNKMYEKKANPGDYIVMVGGRVGMDGIHGATFSSEAMSSGSPATAVQIGDPITQKKLSDATVKEARDRRLYSSMTDNGAGGLSCSVPEMGTESGGCHVYLDRVPLKYPRLDPWKIWISESQERMTLSVPKENWPELEDLFRRRGVEATVIGEFTNSGKCVVEYHGQNLMDVEMDFLENGRPRTDQKTTFTRKIHEEPDFKCLDDLTDSLHSMLGRMNIASTEFISTQYDHEVQGGSVIKPLQGKGRVNGDATVTRPLLSSNRAVAISHGINPSYSDIDTYHMAASAIDTAVRNAVAVGANPDNIALLDNFCWCSSNEPERLGQLKRAVQACYDVAVAYGTPFISGKDSMFNDFKGFDENGKPTKISIPPTLLVSSVAVLDDARKAISLDAKMRGDYVYVLGENYEELGGSEYFAMIGEQLRGERFTGNSVPQVDTEKNLKLYRDFHNATEKGLVASAQGVGIGGLAVALAKTAMGGRMGMTVFLGNTLDVNMRQDYTLFSESQGRFVVTVDPEKAPEFEKSISGNRFARIGFMRQDDRFIIQNNSGQSIVKTNVNDMLNSYKSTFRNY